MVKNLVESSWFENPSPTEYCGLPHLARNFHSMHTYCLDLVNYWLWELRSNFLLQRYFQIVLCTVLYILYSFSMSLQSSTVCHSISFLYAQRGAESINWAGLLSRYEIRVVGFGGLSRGCGLGGGRGNIGNGLKRAHRRGLWCQMAGEGGGITPPHPFIWYKCSTPLY